MASPQNSILFADWPQAAAVASIAFSAYYASQPATSTVTASNLSFGAAAANRIIIAIVRAYTVGTISHTTGVTIGGVNGTYIGSEQDSIGAATVFMFYAAVPTGTVGNIVVTSSAAINFLDIAVYRATGLTNGGAATNVQDTNGTATPSVTLTSVPAGGYVIASVGLISDADTVAWTGAAADKFVDDGGEAMSAASYNNTGGVASNYVVSAVISGFGSTHCVLLAASFI